MFHFENGDAQQAYANAMAATNDNDYQARMRDYARAVSENAASDWLYTRKNFLAVSDAAAGVSEESDRPSAAVEQIDAALIFRTVFACGFSAICLRFRHSVR